MAVREEEIYWESEKELPKISQSCLGMEDPLFEDAYDATELYSHLAELGKMYEQHLIEVGAEPDPRVCNEMFFSSYKLFSGQLSPVIIYSEIVDFFNFDNIHFYNALAVRFKILLKDALGKRICLDTFEKLKKKDEMKYGGAYTPTFADLLKNSRKS